MSTLLRKVWESVLSPSGSTWNPFLPDRRHQLQQQQQQQMMVNSQSSIGEFDRIPYDVIIHILKFLGPKETARLSSVCKCWKLIVLDNRLWIYFLQNEDEPWDWIFFGETNLRFGYPLRALPSPISQLSFMLIYGQRAQVPGSVIIDGGSGYCKFGWSKYNSPSGRSATFMEFGNIESPMYSRFRHFFATIYSRMQVKPSLQPIVVSIPICHYEDTESAKAARKRLKETIYSVLFDMNVPAVCAINQATLALYAARRTSGIVVNIGFHHTSIVPILRGKVMRKVGIETVEIGALKLTGFLREQLQHGNIYFNSLYTVRALKENLCYVALDYKAELSKETKASLHVGPEGWFTLSKERFQTGEILFQPRIAGVHALGLHQAIALCMDHCEAAELSDDSWFKTVVLAGGSACLPGLAERLEKELREIQSSAGIRVIPPPYGADAAWFGAKLVSNLSTFPGPLCMTKKSFRYKSRRGLRW